MRCVHVWCGRAWRLAGAGGRVIRTRAHVAEGLERRVLLSAYTLKTLATFNDPNGLSFHTDALAVDNAGNLFGATSAGGANNLGFIFKLPQGSSTIVPLADFNSQVSDPLSSLLIDANG